MIILTAGDRKFKDFLKVSKMRAENFGYKFMKYDLAGKDFRKVDRVFKNLWKFPLILDAFNKTYDKLVWLDGDAFLWGKLDLDWDFDIGVTMRRQKEILEYDDPLNSGVVFVNNTDKAKEFLEEISETDGKIDQSVLTELVGEVTCFTEYYGVFKRKGVRIKTLPTDKYNCYYFNEKLNDKDNLILHFKGNMRKEAQHFIDFYGIQY